MQSSYQHLQFQFRIRPELRLSLNPEVIGFLWLATVPATSGLVAVMFGTRYMALLYGIVFLGHQIGSFMGGWLGGWLYDRSGSYDSVWWVGVALGVMAAIVHWPIKEKPVSRLMALNT